MCLTLVPFGDHNLYITTSRHNDDSVIGRNNLWMDTLSGSLMPRTNVVGECFNDSIIW